MKAMKRQHFYYKTIEIIEFNDLPHPFSNIRFVIFATEQPLKTFVCTRMRAESIDRQLVFHYKTNEIMEINDFPHIFPQTFFAIRHPLKHVYAPACAPVIQSGSPFLL